MRNVIILFAMMTMLTATSLAATNPDDFEAYTPDPNILSTGASANGWVERQSSANWGISATGGVGASKALQAGSETEDMNVDGFVDSNDIGLGFGDWNVTSAADLQVFEVDFKEGYSGNGYIAFAYTGTKPEALEPSREDGTFVAAFGSEDPNLAETAGKLIAFNGSFDVYTNIPGADVIADWADGAWHHLTVEIDFPNSLVRAKFDSNAFTAWVAMPSGPQNHSNLRLWGVGVNYVDNAYLKGLGLKNPEPFESYFDTASWSPTEAADGWTKTGAAAELGAAYGETDKGLKLNETAQGQWFATLDQILNPSQIFTVDFKSTAAGGSGRRAVISAGDADQGAFNVEIENGTEYNIWLNHYNTASASYDKTYLPDANDWTSAAWHTLTVEMDFATNTARAKLDDNAFTGWVYMPQNDTAAPGPAYSYTNINTNAVAGTFNLDNYYLTVPGGGLSNPDDFESYDFTTVGSASSWNPTEAGQGWSWEDFVYSGPAGNIPNLSISSVAAKDGKKGLRSGNNPVGGALAPPLADGGFIWYATSGADLQTFEMDFETSWAGEDRIIVMYDDAYYGAFTLRFYTAEPPGGSYLGAGYLEHHDDGDPGAYIYTVLPGTEWNGYWSNTGWHHVIVEMDFPDGGGDPNGYVRAAFDYPTNAFTAWVPMPNGGGARLYRHEKVQFLSYGVNHIDNISISPNVDPNAPAAPSYGPYNPEEFTYYDSTGDWAPDQGVDGWTITAPGPNDVAKIGLDYGETGRGLQLSHDNVWTKWDVAYDPEFYPTQTFTADFKNTANSGNFRRIIFSAGAANQGPFSLELTGTNNPPADAFLIHWNETTSSYDTTTLPDPNDWYDMTVWHSVTVEMDFLTHTARAKLNDKAFTAWVHMPEADAPTVYGPAYSYKDITVFGSSGTFQLDNLSLTSPEYTCADALGDGLTLALDANDDCRIGLAEFAAVAGDWLDCMTPGGGGCLTPWLP